MKTGTKLKHMKKLSLLGMLGILMSVSACTEISEIEDPQESIVKQEVVISASHEFDNHTKTVLKEDGSVWWKPNDVIGVFFGTYCSYFIAYNMEDAPTADFIGEALVVQGHTEQSNGNGAKHTYWSVFPPDLTGYEDEEDDNFSYWSGNEDYEEPTREKESVNVFLPVKQKGVAGTFDRNLFISIARSDTYKEFRFYNLCGGLAFCVEKEGIHTVTFKGNADEVLAGGVNVIMNSDNRPVVNEVINGKTEIKLTMPEGEYFVPGEWYYIVMLPASLEEGYTMTFYTDKEKGTLVSSNPVEIKRSVFGKLTNPDSGIEYIKSVPAESVEIRYESDSHLSIGDMLVLRALITPEDCTFPAVWSSSDPSVATVDEDGNVIGVSEGETRITLTVGDMSDYIWVYVYGKGNEDNKVTLVSIDLEGVLAISGIYDEKLGYKLLYAVAKDGTTTPLTFDVESYDEEFEMYVEDKYLLALSESYHNIHFLTEKYMIFDSIKLISTNGDSVFDTSKCFIRVKDGVVLNVNNSGYMGENGWKDGNTYYKWRESYDGKYIYLAEDWYSHGSYYVFEQSGNSLKVTHPCDFSDSQFDHDNDKILLDRDNNLLTYSYGIGYILCNDKSIIPFTIPENPDYEYEVGDFFEVNHTWYYWSGSKYWWEDYYRHYAKLYKVTLENREVVFTEITSVYRDQYWRYNTSYFRRGNIFIWGDDGNYVVIDMDKVEVSYVSVEQHGYAEHITPDGYYYGMENNIIYQYDLLSGEPTVIPTDRSNVPPMTPTSPRYDSNNHCFHESGTRLSDSETITVVTDAETGKVSVYEGRYMSENIWVRLP